MVLHLYFYHWGWPAPPPARSALKLQHIIEGLHIIEKRSELPKEVKTRGVLEDPVAFPQCLEDVGDGDKVLEELGKNLQALRVF